LVEIETKELGYSYQTGTHRVQDIKGAITSGDVLRAGNLKLGRLVITLPKIL